MGLLLSHSHLHGETNNSLQSAFYTDWPSYLNIFIIESFVHFKRCLKRRLRFPHHRRPRGTWSEQPHRRVKNNGFFKLKWKLFLSIWKKTAPQYSKKIFVLLDFPDLMSPSICVNPLKCSILNLSLSLEIPILSIELGRFWGPSCILFSLEPVFLIPGFVVLVLCE